MNVLTKFVRSSRERIKLRSGITFPSFAKQSTSRQISNHLWEGILQDRFFSRSPTRCSSPHPRKMRPAAEGEGTREDWGECRQTPLFGELSKVIPLGQLLPCHSPWEELVLHRGDVCGRATVLPPSSSPFYPRAVWPRLLRKRRPVHSARASRRLLRLPSATPAPHRRARCEKNERRGERTYFSCKRGGSPRHEPRGFCGPRIWPTRQRTKRNISAVFNCSFGGFPPFLSTATRD